MAGLGFDTDENRVVTTLIMLQGRGKLVRMARHDPIVMVRCGDDRGRITGAWVQILQR